MFKKLNSYYITDIIRTLIDPDKDMTNNIDLLTHKFHIIHTANENDILNKIKYTMLSEKINGFYSGKHVKILGSIRHNGSCDKITIDFKCYDNGDKKLQAEHCKYVVKMRCLGEGFISSTEKMLTWHGTNFPDVLSYDRYYLYWIFEGDNNES